MIELLDSLFVPNKSLQTGGTLYSPGEVICLSEVDERRMVDMGRAKIFHSVDDERS